MADWTRSRPSDLLNMRAEGFEAAECLDLDLAVMAWWDRFEGMRNERKAVHESTQPRLGPRQVWGNKYASDRAILDALMGTSAVVMDPVVAGMTADDLMGLLDGWDA